MKAAVVPDVFELIHAAALCPSAWGSVLRHLASLTGCVAGGLTVERPATRQGVPLTYFGFDRDHVARSFDHYLPLNPLFQIEARMQKGFVVTNGDVVALDTFRRSEFYNGWARPQGLCSPVTVVIHRTKTAYVPLTLVRPDGAGEVTAEDRALLFRLAPHLVHAMDVTIRLQAARRPERDFKMVLEALACGAVLINQEKRIVFANQAAHNLFGSSNDRLLRCVSGRIVVCDLEANRRFQTAVSAALGQSGCARGSQLSLPHASGNRQFAVRLSPMPVSEDVWNAVGNDLFGQARCMILVSTSDVAKLAQDHGLTPAETRVLSAVTVGKGLNAAARELGISRSTVQSHLDKIFQKTGTNRQAELVGLVQAGIGL